MKRYYFFLPMKAHAKAKEGTFHYGDANSDSLIFYWMESLLDRVQKRTAQTQS